MKVLALGDTHGDWERTERILNRYLKENPDITDILQVGDFGYWPKVSQWHEALSSFLDERDAMMWFADGNHEDHEALDALPADEWNAIDRAGRVRHVKRGRTIMLDGKRILFFGGAVSVDKNSRTAGIDWFPREVPNRREWELAYTSTVDVVVAHDVPDIAQPFYPDRGPWPQELHNASLQFRNALTGLSEAIKPKLWLSGHHHARFSAYKNGTRYETLACNGMPFSEWATIIDFNKLDRE